MNDADKATVWIGACRYYMGRMTYAVGNFCEALRREWPTLPEHAKSIINRDLEEEIKRDDAARADGENGVQWGYLPLGHDCDREKWLKVRALWK